MTVQIDTNHALRDHLPLIGWNRRAKLANSTATVERMASRKLSKTQKQQKHFKEPYDILDAFGNAQYIATHIRDVRP